MQITGLIQGSAEWHAHRANHFNASDAPAMLGESAIPEAIEERLKYRIIHGEKTNLDQDLDLALKDYSALNIKSIS